MFDRKLPDKAVDMLDEIGSYYRMDKSNVNPELTNLYHDMHSILETTEKTTKAFSSSKLQKKMPSIFLTKKFLRLAISSMILLSAEDLYKMPSKF